MMSKDRSGYEHGIARSSHGSEASDQGRPAKELSRIDDSHPALIFVDGPTLTNIPGQLETASFTAQLSGTFLPDQHPGQPSERQIICYRRNLFHIRGTIVLRRKIDANHGAALDVVQIHAVLSATESNNEEEVAIITVPKTNSPSAGSKAPAPIDITLDTQSDAPIGFSWSRLQFRSATAKAGRRKEKSAEQQFTLHIRFYFILSDNSKILASEKSSARIVVRGRSPGNFSVTKDSRDEREHLLHNCEPDIATGQGTTRLLNISALHGGTVPNPDNSTFNGILSDDHEVNVFVSPLPSIPGEEPESQNTCYADFLADHYGTPSGSIAGLSSFDFFNFPIPDGFANGQSIQPLRGVSPPPPASTWTEAAAPSSRRGSSPSVAQVQLENEAVERLPSSYKYIPLDANDRTPPVHAVYVSSLFKRCVLGLSESSNHTQSTTE